MFIIDMSNYHEAEQAVRDILFLYRDAILSYGGFGHNLETGTFDPFKFLDCALNEPSYHLAIDLQLLHEGSAAAILCDVLNLIDDHECLLDGSSPLSAKIKQALEDSRFEDVPLAAEAVRLAFLDEELFRAKLLDVYSRYIVGYVKQLLIEAIGYDRMPDVG